MHWSFWCHLLELDVIAESLTLRVKGRHLLEFQRLIKQIRVGRVPFLFVQNRRFMTGLNIFALQKSVVANSTELGNIAIKPMTILFVFITYWLVF